MTIVYLSNSIIPSSQANSIHVMKMSQAFSRLGHKVILISVEPKESVDDVYAYYGVDKGSFEIVSLNREVGIKSFKYSFEAIKKIKQIKPDLVYGRCLVSCYLSSLYGFNTMYESHSFIFNDGFVKSIIFKGLILSSNLKKIVVISDALKDMYLNRYPKLACKIVVAHDASDEVISFNDKIENMDSTKQSVGYFGHLYPGRGIDIIIELAQRLPKIDFHIVGGNKEDIKYWKSLYYLDNLNFHGFVPPSEVYKYRNSCDILLAPYQNRVSVAGNSGDTSKFMSPLKIFEYMSSKKPIICSDLKVLREVLNDDNSVLIECNNVDAWERAIVSIIDDNKKADELATKSYNDFLAKYTWLQRAKDLLKDNSL